MNGENYYSILGVTPNATIEEIKQRFKYLAFVYHPDRFSEPFHRIKAEEDFKKINEAYSVLSDISKRAKYDELIKSHNAKKTAPQKSDSPSSKISREDIIKMIDEIVNGKSMFSQKLNLSNLDLSYMDLSAITDTSKAKAELVITNSILYKTDLSKNSFGFADFSGCNLSSASFEESFFLSAKINAVNLEKTNFMKARFHNLNLENLDFSGCNLSNASFYEVRMKNIVFHSAIMFGVDFDRVAIDGGNFYEADLRNANLKRTKFRSTSFENTNLSNANLWLSEAQGCDFSNANMRSAKLSDGNFEKANFTKSNLSNAELSSANFNGANLNMAELIGAKYAEHAIIDNTTILPDGNKKSLFSNLGKFV